MQTTAVKNFDNDTIHWTESIWKVIFPESLMVRLPNDFE